jgi:hypothetical protein
MVAGRVVEPVCLILMFIFSFTNLSLYHVRLHLPRIDCRFQPLFTESKSRSLYDMQQLALTIQKLELDSRRSVFSHGQLYSAMTRVPDSENGLILKYEDDESTSTDNIIWKELLL